MVSMKNRKCRLCGMQISNRVSWHGKIVNTSSRKYCFTCSPFGCRNRKKLHPSNKVCVVCGTSLVGNQSKYCSVTCNNRVKNKRRHRVITRYDSDRRRNNAKRAVEYLGGKCSRCGFVGPPICYDFHHLNPTNKDSAMSTIFGRSWNKIKMELDKCQLLCANCHMEIHEEWDNKIQRDGMNAYMHEYNQKRKRMAVQYLGGRCVKCGYSKCQRAMTFHHLTEKDFTLSGHLNRAWKRLIFELDKCSLLCQNCHRKQHDWVCGQGRSTALGP